MIGNRTWEDNARQRVSAFTMQFTRQQGFLFYRHKGVGPAYTVTPEQQAAWTAEFSDTVHRSYRRIMVDAVLMMISLVASIQYFGGKYAGIEYALGVAHLLILATFEWFKENAAWNAPLNQLRGRAPVISGGGHNDDSNWFDRVDGMAAQSTPQLILGVLVGALVAAFSMMVGLQERDIATSFGEWAGIIAISALGGLISILALITLIRRFQRR